MTTTVCCDVVAWRCFSSDTAGRRCSLCSLFKCSYSAEMFFDVSVVRQGLYKLFMEIHQTIIKKFKSGLSDSLTDITISCFM